MGSRSKFKPKFHADMVLAQMLHERESMLDQISRLMAALEVIASDPKTPSVLATIARQALGAESPDPAP